MKDLKNSQIERTVVLIRELKNEPVSLGVKIRLAKIEKVLLSHFKEFEKVRTERILKDYPEMLTLEKETELKASGDLVFIALIDDLNELMNENNSFDFETIDFLKIENLESSKDYSVLAEFICD